MAINIIDMIMTNIQIGAFVLIIPLLASAIIDVRYFIIPNLLNMFILISGLIFSVMTDNLSLKHSICGVLLGGIITYALSYSFFRLKGHVGLGLGEAKSREAVRTTRPSRRC